jgi:hypothetical protein
MLFTPIPVNNLKIIEKINFPVAGPGGYSATTAAVRLQSGQKRRRRFQCHSHRPHEMSGDSINILQELPVFFSKG